MTIDFLLYVAFGFGFLLGRITKWRSPWIGHATVGTIIVLIFVLGASLGTLTGVSTLLTIPVGLGFAGVVLGLTAGISYLLPRPQTETSGIPSPPQSRVPLSAVFLGSLVVGYGVGHVVSFPTSPPLTASLYVLLALVAFDLKLSRRALNLVWIPVLAAVSGAVIAGLALGLLTPLGIPAALATALGFGWYTLTGPLVAARLGAGFGLLAFLTNFFRENLTMLFAPYVGHRLRGEGLSAMGGATAMDTTLYFVTRYGDPEAGSLALATGLILTVTASLVLPVVLSLP